MAQDKTSKDGDKTTCRGKYIGLSLAGGSGDDEDHT